LQQTYDWIASYAELAQQENLDLIAAEGGQSLRPYGGTENNAAIVNLLQQANRDPRMGDLYREYFSKWQELGGSLMAHFHDINRYDKYSTFGALEHVNQPSSPKHDAIMDLLTTVLPT
jgi:hypothetical protein